MTNNTLILLVIFFIKIICLVFCIKIQKCSIVTAFSYKMLAGMHINTK